MDSLSQMALGAALSVAIMRRRVAPWKAALVGAVAGTLPDLDTLVHYTDAVDNMTRHRADSHALLYLALFAPILAGVVSWLSGTFAQWRWWWLAMSLALLTHPLLDYFTIYGTQLLRPLTSTPFGLGSLFIIDPLYTLPLLVGLIITLWRSRKDTGHNTLSANAWGLGLSTAYLLWSVGAQTYVKHQVEQQLTVQQQQAYSVMVTPAPFNTVLWRVVLRSETDYQEGFYSLFDGSRPVRFQAFAHDASLAHALQDLPQVQRMVWFTHGFYIVRRQGDRAILSDVRMGQEPMYVFSFEVAQLKDNQWQAVPTQNIGGRPQANITLALRWLWQRMWGVDIDPPRSLEPL